MLFSQTFSVPGLSQKVREKYKFDNYTLIIDTESLEWYYWFYNEFDLVVNELLSNRAFNISRLQAKTASG